LTEPHFQSELDLDRVIFPKPLEYFKNYLIANSIMREERRFEIEVHAAAVCVRKEGDYEVLVGRRSPKRKLYPGLWECGGGQVNPGENFEEAVVRQVREELGTIVEVIAPIGVYEILTPDLPQKKIPGVKFLCEVKGYVNGKGPEIDRNEFTEWRWITPDETAGMDFIPGIPDEIKMAVGFMKSRKNG
jgi:8-oxo-dGTP diphosphatase